MAASRGNRWVGVLTAMVFSCSWLPPGQVAAGVVKHVRTTGAAAVLAGDTAQAFQQARREALRQAVEEGVGVLVGGLSLVAGNVLVDDVIRTDTGGLVRSFTVVDSSEGVDQIYRVTIDAEVALDTLSAALEGMGLSGAQLGRPHVRVRGSESLRSNGALSSEHWGIARSAMEQILRNRADAGWVIIADTDATADRSDGQVSSGPSGAEEWVDMELDVTAVVEKAVALPVPMSTSTLEDLGITSATATVHVECRWTDTHELVAAVEGSSRGAGTTLQSAGEEAIRNGVHQVVPDVLRQIAEDWRQRAYSSRLVRLELLADPAARTVFQREFVARLAAAQDIEARRLDRTGGLYTVRATASGFDLARQLASVGMGGMQVEVLRVTQNSLTLRVVE